MRETGGMKRPWLILWLLGSALTFPQVGEAATATDDEQQFSDMQPGAPPATKPPPPTSPASAFLDADHAPLLPETAPKKSIVPTDAHQSILNSPALTSGEAAAAGFSDANRQIINGVLAKLKLAQVAAIRELANLVACPKIDPKHKPNLYSHDTQVYYFGRIFQAFKNTNLKIMLGLKTNEVTFIKSQLSEESFRKAFQQTLAPLYKSPTVKTGEQNDLSILSDASALALDAIFSDAAERFSESAAAKETANLVADGSILSEKPGTTLKRPAPGAAEVHAKNQNKFSDFFDHYRNTSKVLYLSNQRSNQLSPAGAKLCNDLDSNKLQYERWEEPKVETRVDSSAIDGSKAVQQIVAQVKKEHPKVDAKPDGFINVDALSTPVFEAEILPQLHEQAQPAPPLDLLTSADKKQRLAGLSNADEAIEGFSKIATSEFPDILVNSNNIYQQTDEVKQAKSEIVNSYGQAILEIFNQEKYNFPNTEKTQEEQLLGFVTTLRQQGDNAHADRIAGIINSAKAARVKAINDQVISRYEKLSTQRWKVISKSQFATQLTPQQRYYLAWAANIAARKMSTDDNDAAMIGVILDEQRKKFENFKQFTPKNLLEISLISKTNQNCYFCTQPIREDEKSDYPNTKNSLLGQEILGSGADAYRGLIQLSHAEQGAMPAEVLYNLSVAMNYLSAGGSEQRAMPDLVVERKAFPNVKSDKKLL